MRLPVTRDEAVRLASFLLKFECVAVLLALALAVPYAGVAGTRLSMAFAIVTFVLFLVVLLYAVLSGPGLFLSRPRLPPMGTREAGRWRRAFGAPAPEKDREFSELALYTVAAFLLLAIATGIGALLQVLGG